MCPLPYVHGALILGTPVLLPVLLGSTTSMPVGEDNSPWCLPGDELTERNTEQAGVPEVQNVLFGSLL